MLHKLYHFQHILCDVADVGERESVVGREGEDARGDVFGNRTSAASVDVRRKVGEERIEVTTRKNVCLFKLGVNALAGGKGVEEDGDIRLVDGIGQKIQAGRSVIGPYRRAT